MNTPDLLPPSNRPKRTRLCQIRLYRHSLRQCRAFIPIRRLKMSRIHCNVERLSKGPQRSCRSWGDVGICENPSHPLSLACYWYGSISSASG